MHVEVPCVGVKVEQQHRDHLVRVRARVRVKVRVGVRVRVRVRGSSIVITCLPVHLASGLSMAGGTMRKAALRVSCTPAR